MAGDVVGAARARDPRSVPRRDPGRPGAAPSGEAGIGKTTVWKEGLDGARRRRYRTLSCGPVEAETRLSYAALGDLLEPVLEDALPTLPEPQRRALEVALLRAPSSGARADQRAVFLAVLGCLRSVATGTPVVVAIDDIQWMDLPSVRVLQFVSRRLKEEAVGLMAAVQGSDPDEDPLGRRRGASRWSRASRPRRVALRRRDRTGAPRQGG